MILETETAVILIDPMLGTKGSFSGFTFVRFRYQRNPIVHLPAMADSLLKKVTHCVITHKHEDHVDKAGEKFLRDFDVPVICSAKDKEIFQQKGLKVIQTLDYWKPAEFLGGTIEGIPARHGYGYVAKPMGEVMGFMIKLPKQPSIYLSSDTVYTEDVEKVLTEYNPDISVVACGTAQLDLFQPLLMRMNDIVRFVKAAPGKVICNHLEAVNHCPTTREQLRQILEKEQLLNKVWIPVDGEEKSY